MGRAIFERFARILGELGKLCRLFRLYGSYRLRIGLATGPVLVDFWAPWCGPCRQIAPMIEELASENAGSVRVLKINIDDNPKTPQRFNVRGIPTLILFKNGQVEGQKVGALRKSDLAAFLESKL